MKIKTWFLVFLILGSYYYVKAELKQEAVISKIDVNLKKADLKKADFTETGPKKIYFEEMAIAELELEKTGLKKKALTERLPGLSLYKAIIIVSIIDIVCDYIND